MIPRCFTAKSKTSKKNFIANQSSELKKKKKKKSQYKSKHLLLCNFSARQNIDWLVVVHLFFRHCQPKSYMSVVFLLLLSEKRGEKDYTDIVADFQCVIAFLRGAWLIYVLRKQVTTSTTYIIAFKIFVIFVLGIFFSLSLSLFSVLEMLGNLFFYCSFLFCSYCCCSCSWSQGSAQFLVVLNAEKQHKILRRNDFHCAKKVNRKSGCFDESHLTSWWLFSLFLSLTRQRIIYFLVCQAGNVESSKSKKK